MNPRPHSLLPLLLGSLLITACSAATDAPVEDVASVTAETHETEAPAAAEPAQPSLLLDPAFTEGEAPENLKHWRLYQHAGERSYVLSIEDGAATLERVGIEPWGQITQTLPADAYAGKTLEWSAELEGELDDRYGEPFQASGLSVSVTGLGPGDLPMMGARHLLTQSTDPGLPAGVLERGRQRLQFVVPAGSELKLQVSVILTRGGYLRVRNPQLRIVDAAEAAQP